MRALWFTSLCLLIGCSDDSAGPARVDDAGAVYPDQAVSVDRAQFDAAIDSFLPSRDAGVPADMRVSSGDLGQVADGSMSMDSAVSSDASIALDSEILELDSGSAEPVNAVSNRAIYRPRVTQDVVYGQGLRRQSWDSAEGEVVDLTLDIAVPEGAPEANRPALVIIHGGGFRSGDSRQGQLREIAGFFVQRGWVALSINYRLQRDYGSIPVRWPPFPVGDRTDQVNAMYPAGRDAKAAIRWLHANAELYGVHPDYITALGGSAGSYIAIMLGVSDPGDYRDEISADDDPTLATTHLDARSDVATVIDHWGGATMIDLLQLRDGQNRFDSADAPISIVHGRDDPTVVFALAEALRDACQSNDVPYAFYPFDGGHSAWNVTIDGRNLKRLAFDFIVEHQRLEILEE